MYCDHHKCEFTGIGQVVFCPKCEVESENIVAYIWGPQVAWDMGAGKFLAAGSGSVITTTRQEAEKHRFLMEERGGALYSFLLKDYPLNNEDSLCQGTIITKFIRIDPLK